MVEIVNMSSSVKPPQELLPTPHLTSGSSSERATTCIKFNQSDPFHIGDKYGGIPLNLMTNSIGWVVLLVLFFLIRKNVMKKLATTTRQGVDVVAGQWTQIFFGRSESNDLSSESLRTTESDQDEAPLNDDGDDGLKQTVTHVEVKEEEENVVIDHIQPGFSGDNNVEDDAVSRRSHHNLIHNAKILTIQEKKLVDVMGPDAVQYLRFQKYVIIYIFFTCAVSCFIILPINIHGSQIGNGTDFGGTTLANLNPKNDQDSIFLWIHVLIAFLMFPAAIFLMRRFSIGLKMTDTNLKITRTVAIENIPPANCTIDKIKRHFAEVYPDFPIYDVQVVYNVTKLITLSDQLENVQDSLKFCKRFKDRHKVQLEMYPYTGARCCKCFCFPCVNKVTCLEFFKEEELKLERMIEKEKAEVKKDNLGMAFVTFENINHARQVLRDHQNSVLNFKRRCRESSENVHPEKWRVWFAPPPNDIIWENMSNRSWTLVKKIIANLFIFLVAFFLSTPQFIVNQLEPILNALKNLTGSDDSFNPGTNETSPPIIDHIRYLPIWLTDFLPTLMLWTFTALLPVVIAWADLLVGHWTRSGQNHAIMKKTFWYLLFMVIILPTFGFTSAQAYIDFLLRNGDLNWECIFLPDSGAFFVNYVITTAMIGSGLELIRFPELFWYLIQICWSRSKADTPAIRKAIKYEFRFGEQYARMMLIFAMVVMFSLSCPLITPFGLLYFILKHLVDRHNLAFVYARSRINKKVHATAINFVIMSVALLQFFMVIFSYIRSLEKTFSSLDMRTKVSLGLFIITLNVCSAQIWSNTCRKISPIKYEDVMLWEDKEDGHDKLYLPKVLFSKNQENSVSTSKTQLNV